MRAVLEHLSANDEIAVVGFGQSNRRPWGHRDKEGFVAAPHLKLRSAGMDLTIAAIASLDGAAHGAIGTSSVVTIAENVATYNEWIGGELRLVHHEYGDSVASSLRVGHGTVLASGLVGFVYTGGGGLTIDLATSTFLWPKHRRVAGSQVMFTNTGGALPSPLVAGVVYYVRDVTENAFKVSLDPHGTAVTLSGGSGVHAVTGRPFLVVQWLSAFQADQAATFSIGTPGIVNQTAHGRTAGSTVTYAGTLPPELTAGVQYYVVGPTADTYSVSATFGGAAIAFSGAGGAATATPRMLAFVSGYVHLHDRWKSYDNVHVVTPYQPIEPGDYPAGAPVVPGFTLPTDVTGYADAALVLPFTFTEGIDGYGAAGTATVSGLVVTLQGGLTLVPTLFADGFIRVGGAKGQVATNAAGTVTVKSWTPAAGPGAGTLPFELHLPHWRNNPHHFTAGEGFLYPSNDMQPGGNAVTSLGVIYSRPRGRLVGSYNGRVLNWAPTSVATSALTGGYARMTTTASGQLTISVVAGKLRVQRATTSRDPVTGVIQFEDIVRPGHIFQLFGTGQTPNVDGIYRVSAVGHTTAAAGSYVDLEQLSETDIAVPVSVSGTVPSGVLLTRLFWEVQHRFGSLIELCWRMAVAVGRRIVAVHLGINSSGQILRNTNNAFGFQGKIGWRDDDESLDWTPSNDDGNAARLQRLVEFIAPRAVKATFGSARQLKVLAIDGWQAEADAYTVAGRELASRSIPTFANWLRSVILAAGLSPYHSTARIPLHWAQVSAIPYELAGTSTLYPGLVFTGDSEGIINSVLARMAALDGFAASIDTDNQPKLDGTTFWGADPLHFNGFGEATNGKLAAEALLPLIDLAFSFALGGAAVDIANEALSLIGEQPIVTALEPPTPATHLPRLCAQHLPAVLREILQLHPWTFATRRVRLQAITSSVSTWLYAYAVPADLLHPTLILPPDAPDDLQLTWSRSIDPGTGLPLLSGGPASQPFKMENEDGFRVLRTNQEDAVAVYIARNVDLSLWDPLVRKAAAYRLAHALSGGTIKGKTGMQVATTFLQMSYGLVQQAAGQNAEYQQDVRPQNPCPWLPGLS